MLFHSTKSILLGRSQSFLITCTEWTKSRCLIPSTGRRSTSPPFARLHSGWMISCLLDSSYWMDENTSSFRATSYRTNNVRPALFLLPDGRGQALLSHNYLLDRRRAAYLIHYTEWTRNQELLSHDFVLDGRNPDC